MQFFCKHRCVIRKNARNAMIAKFDFVFNMFRKNKFVYTVQTFVRYKAEKVCYGKFDLPCPN